MALLESNLNSPTSDVFSAPGSFSNRSFSPVASASRAASPAIPPNALLECPLGLSYLEFVKQWSDTHVAQWLAESKVPQHASRFKENDIRGDVILDLDQATLKETGIVSVGDRIKILVAVKALRQKCMRSASVVKPPAASLRIEESTTSNIDKEPSPMRSGSQRSRPPPIRIAHPSNTDLPQAVNSALGIPFSARSVATPRYIPSNSSSGTPVISVHASRSNLPPPAPAPKTQAPTAPQHQPPRPTRNGTGPLGIPAGHPINGRRTPEPPSIPPSFTKDPLPPAPGPHTSSGVHSNWGGDYGLPARPSPGNLQGGTFADKRRGDQFGHSNSPVPYIPPRTQASTRPLHTKTGSLSQMSKPVGVPSPPQVSRPATSGDLPSSQHPYGALPPPVVRELPQSLPNLHVNVPPAGTFTLSPIVESTSRADSPLATPSTNGYAVGRGPFGNGRPNTPSQHATMSLAEVKRKTVKFILADDRRTGLVNVSDCEAGVTVIERALRKMGKLTPGPLTTGETEEGGLIVNGWVVYLEAPSNDGPIKPLTETEVLTVCHADVTNPARDHGLTLRKINPGQRWDKLERIFGAKLPRSHQTSPTSPTHSTGGFSNVPKLAMTGPEGDEPVNSPSPVYSSSSLSPGSGQSAANKKLARASTISIMSGLGVVPPPPPEPTSPSKSPSFLANPQKKLRNFFGQRPPSELITSNLGDFFPQTNPKVLERTARYSMLRNSGSIKRDSIFGGSVRSSWNSSMKNDTYTPRTSISPTRDSVRTPNTPPNRSPSSKSSRRRTRQVPPVVEEPIPLSESILPRMSISTDGGESINIPSDSDEVVTSSETTDEGPKTPHVLPPVLFGDQSLTDSLTERLGPAGFLRSDSVASKRTSRRASYMSELRSKRDRSDTASILTVDEITAEVESRQSLEAESPGPSSEGTTLNDDVAVPSKILEEDESDEDEEYESGEEESEDDDDDDEETEEEAEPDVPVEADEDEIGKAVTSTGGKRSIKWIKGALIGAGSFGSVYLGMDAFHGLLMAVKQVELPTGSSTNEERKKSMLTALEREIALLKELQHENIVQYYDSAMDAHHLNIFLEYVPGGSVVTLLRNYGAFEEALVRNWVKQILVGLEYLHGRDIIHRDIKGANILVDNKGGIKISDFGISKKAEIMPSTTARNRTSLQGSVFWMAPEVVKQTAYTSKADIWSVGCLVVEMLTGERPWAKLNEMQAIFKIGSSARPAIPPDISEAAVDFLNKTFELDYNARLSATDLLQHPWLTQESADP